MADGRSRPVTLHRFFLTPGSLDSDEIALPAEQAHQIRRVLRLRAGDRIVVLDGSGREAVVRLDEVANRVLGVIEERRTNEAEPTAALVLYMGIVKVAKLELVLQKGTELGVDRFVPVVSERSVPGKPNTVRLRRFETIVREAAEQCRRGRLPRISPPLSFEEATQEAGPCQSVLLWENERNLRLSRVKLQVGQPAGLLAGPEGGFTAEEVSMAKAAGIRVASLGTRVLRAETAAIVGAALMLTKMGELG